MYSHQTTTRVRYADTDQMGYMYYGHYAKLYEIGRVELLRDMGYTYRDMEHTHRVMMPVMSMQTRYLRPALYDDLLTIETSLRSLEKMQIVFHFEIRNEANKLLNAGRVKLCFVDMQTQQRAPMPTYLYDMLLPYFS